MNLVRIARGFLALMALACGATPAVAQSYPDKAVRIIVPYAPGGSTDSTARLIAQALSQQLGQPFVVENRPGAGGLIAHEAVAKAAADGYTLLFSAAGPLVVSPHTYARLPYEPIRSFEPIKLISTAPLLLVVNPKFQAGSVQELIKYAAANPGKVTYGSFGNGSAAHLAGEQFKILTKVDIVHIPYKGSAPALTDLVGGQIDMMFDVLVTALPQVKGGRLRALAITSPERSPLVSDAPTMQEAGVKGFDAGTWFGVLAPAGTPKNVIDALSKALDATLAKPEFREAIVSQGAFVAGGTPQQFGEFFRSELDKWGAVVRAAKIKAE
jgi:tripartite-type tricarboxylate transporter receptor subunit TctC